MDSRNHYRAFLFVTKYKIKMVKVEGEGGWKNMVVGGKKCIKKERGKDHYCNMETFRSVRLLEKREFFRKKEFSVYLLAL